MSRRQHIVNPESPMHLINIKIVGQLNIDSKNLIIVCVKNNTLCSDYMELIATYLWEQINLR